jgi:tetraacyldisaccharide 4'-kinase
MRLRALAYQAGLLHIYRLSKPVVSVGNITAGGTGKTPMVALLARYCMGRGKRVAVLSRGYGGSLHGETRIVSDGQKVLLTACEAGDEPFMLASGNPGLIVVIGPDRYKAGVFAQDRLDPDIFILDDGYQHIRLHRDLNILLLDCLRPFGNGNVLPAGLLREPRSATERADLIIYTRCGEKQPVDEVPDIPVCRATHLLTGVVPLSGGELLPLSHLLHLQGLAFAGIAEPSSFFTMLEEAGMKICAQLIFPDHCRYDNVEIMKIRSALDSDGADYLITTRKDAVKLSSHLDNLDNVYVAVLEVKIAEMQLL